MRKKILCLTLAAVLALTMCTGAALAYSQTEDSGVLYCHGGGHHGGGGSGGGRHGNGRHGSQTAATEPAYPWLFCPSKGCVDVSCTDANHFHYCSALCADPAHEHYCELEDAAFSCGESWHRSGCGHEGTVVYSKGCTDDRRDCKEAGHYHHCSADCADPAHEHFTVCRHADGSIELVRKAA